MMHTFMYQSRQTAGSTHVLPSKTRYQFRVLPFSLNTAPQVFTHTHRAHSGCLPPSSGDLSNTVSQGLASVPPRPSSFALPPVSASKDSNTW